MPQYKVLRPIENNGRLYLPADQATSGKIRSAGNGSEIAVDTTGVIVLTETEAAAFTSQQICLLQTGKPGYGPTPIPEHAIGGTNPTPVAMATPVVTATPAKAAGPTPIPEHAIGGTNPTPVATATPAKAAGPTPIPEHAIGGTNPAPVATATTVTAAGPTPIPESQAAKPPAPVK